MTPASVRRPSSSDPSLWSKGKTSRRKAEQGPKYCDRLTAVRFQDCISNISALMKVEWLKSQLFLVCLGLKVKCLHKEQLIKMSEWITAGNQTEISKYFIGHDKRSTKGSERGVSQHIKNKSSLHRFFSLPFMSFSLIWHKHSGFDEQDWSNSKSHGLWHRNNL